MDMTDKPTHADDFMEGPTFKMLSANLQMIMAVHKTQGEVQRSANNVISALIMALDEGRINFHDKRDREILGMALALLLVERQYRAPQCSATLH